MKKKVMIVDDDASIVDSMKVMLEISGYEVVTSENGNVSRNVLEAEPDLLLLDIWMPGVDGKTICKELKDDAQTKELPVIMVSASRDVKSDSLEAGADDFLEKPFEMDDLLALVEKYVE